MCMLCNTYTCSPLLSNIKKNNTLCCQTLLQWAPFSPVKRHRQLETKDDETLDMDYGSKLNRLKECMSFICCMCVLLETRL